MKIFQKISIAIIASFLLLMNCSIVKALPPLPSSFWGTVKVNGENIPIGTEVSAWINGIQYAFTTAIMDKGESVYFFDIPGDDPTTPGIIEGGIQGDTIIFKIGNFVADQTASWASGTNVRKDLTAEGLFYFFYLPLIRR